MFILIKVDDSLPRIRYGLTLSSVNSTVAHFVNLQTISCEAIKPKWSNDFDSIEWYTADSTFSLSERHYELVHLSDMIDNYTSTFPIKTNLLRNNSIYKCCTLLNDKIVSCQRFLAYIYLPPATTTTTTVSTTTTTRQFNTPNTWSNPLNYAPIFKILEKVENIFYGNEKPRDAVSSSQTNAHFDETVYESFNSGYNEKFNDSSTKKSKFIYFSSFIFPQLLSKIYK